MHCCVSFGNCLLKQSQVKHRFWWWYFSAPSLPVWRIQSLQGRLISHLCHLCATVHSPRDLSLKSRSYHMSLPNIQPMHGYPDKKALIKNPVRFLWEVYPKYMSQTPPCFYSYPSYWYWDLQNLGQDVKPFISSPYIRFLNFTAEGEAASLSWEEWAAKKGLGTHGQTWGWALGPESGPSWQQAREQGCHSYSYKRNFILSIIWTGVDLSSTEHGLSTINFSPARPEQSELRRNTRESAQPQKLIF